MGGAFVLPAGRSHMDTSNHHTIWESEEGRGDCAGKTSEGKRKFEWVRKNEKLSRRIST